MDKYFFKGKNHKANYLFPLFSFYIYAHTSECVSNYHAPCKETTTKLSLFPI